MLRLLRFALVTGLLLPLAAQAQAPRIEAALDHANAVAAALDLGETEFAVTDAYRNARTGVDYVYLRQTLAGLEVVGAEATVTIGRGGEVAHAVGLERLVDQAAVPARTVPDPSLTAADAAEAVARHNGLGVGLFAVLEQDKGPDRAARLSDGGVAAEEIPARLVWHVAEGGAPALAWEVVLYQADAQHAWLAYVDAATGAVRDQMDLVAHDTWGHGPVAAPSYVPFADLAPAALASGYRVYGLPVEAPIYAATTPPADGRTLETDPEDATASPYGWHDTNGAAGAEYTITRGNNVHAYTDVDANNSPDSGSSPNGGSGLTFDFPLDLTQPPSAYRPASVTNLFYWNNVIHDVMYQYGFDEPAGNFQVNNYGNGGAGNDDVRAEAQDGSGTNNANFYTPRDGFRPRMQMYIGTYANPDVDGSFDNGVVVHEYGHGISNRLTGGPSQAGCLGNAEQMGEGWSDWYAMMFTMRSGDARTDSRGMGNYLFDYGPNGGGIRLAPYDTDFADNGYTYGDTQGMSAVHQIGFVWATILWEVTWDMIDAHGFSADLYNASGTAGNQLMMQLVTEGMKLQPCSPGFVTGRDGILAAEQALYGGAYAATLQAAFARRGLGYSASQGSSNSTSDNVEAFDLWPTGGPGNNAPTAAFSVSCTGLACQFTDASSDSDGTVVSRSWSFGDGGSSSATNPSHTYPGSGSYTATLTVTDDDGATDTASQTVSVTAPGGAITLSSSTRRFWWWYYTDLSWTPADGGSVAVYLNGSSIGTTADDGAVSVNMGTNPNGTYSFQVCETESGGSCSNVSSVSFLESLAADLPREEGPAPTTPPDGPDVLRMPGANLSAEIAAEVQVAPNPMAGTGRVTFGLEEAADVELVVFNAIGQRVAVLAEGRFERGTYDVAFDTGALPSGVYLWRFRSGVDVQSGRIVIAR